MRRPSVLWMLTLMLSSLSVFTGCSSKDEDSPSADSYLYEMLGLTRNAASSGNTGIVVRLFERGGMKYQVVDITDRFQSATVLGRNISVNHVFVEQLPTAIQEMVIEAGASMSTRVCRMEYGGEYYYDIFSLFSSTWVNLFDSNGERYSFQDADEYEAFMDKATNICCILVLASEPLKNAEGAPNHLVGYWQTDWQHLVHDHDRQATVALYPDLPFSITEVMAFHDDGTGYLRTVKAYKDGTSEVALDPFNYVLTDYHGGEEYGYQGYYYKCYFAAGDAIEYLGRSYDGMQTLYRSLYYVNYPWFRQSEDRYESLRVNAGQKYGNPGRDADSPVVGRWSGDFSSDAIAAAGTFTWVFRSDNTGYRLLNGQLNETFAYTVAYEGSLAELTIYKYNTGFLATEGFSKDGADLNFDAAIVPRGVTVKARIDGNILEMEGWSSHFQRVD